MLEADVESCRGVRAPISGDAAGPWPPHGDRWLEGDFRFFDVHDLRGSTRRFFERFGDYYRKAEGWVGLQLNVGWLMPYWPTRVICRSVFP